jgi:hypothetical protein
MNDHPGGALLGLRDWFYERRLIMAELNKLQPEPTKNMLPAVWDLVITDMHERDSIGEVKYKTRLQPDNGRDALVDAYQEALDLVVYLLQAIFERDRKLTDEEARLKRIVENQLKVLDHWRKEFDAKNAECARYRSALRTIRYTGSWETATRTAMEALGELPELGHLA